MQTTELDEKSLFIIINPLAGRGRALKLAPHIENFFHTHNLNFKIRITGEKGEATSLSRKASIAGYKTVVAVGGDGTVNEVVNGLVGSSTAMGIIPCGFGNDCARTLSLPKNWNTACHCIIQRKLKEVDVGIANDRYFINATGSGFDAAVAKELMSYKYPFRGIWPYLFAVLKMLVRFKRNEIKLEFDGSQISTKAWLVAVTNGSTYGGGMKICPNAKIDDGLLDFCIVGDISIWLTFYYLPLIIAGKHMNLSKIYSGKATRIKLTVPDYYFHMEGEVMKNSKFDIHLKPHALKVIVA